MSHFISDTQDDSEEASHAPYPEGLYPWYVVAVLLVVTLLATIDRGAMNVLILPIQRDFGLSEIEMGLILGPAFTVFYILAGLLMGIFADKSNRRNLLAAGVLIWSLGTFVSGLATGFNSLFAARAVVGFGEACVIPAAFSIIADYFAPGRRGTALAIASLGISTGSGVALVASGAILRFMEGYHGSLPIVGSREPWELVFMSLGIFGAAVCLLLQTLREPPRRTAGTQDDTSGASFLSFMSRNRGAMFFIITPFVLFTAMGYIIGAWGPTVIVRHYDVSVSAAAEIKGLVLVICAPAGTLLGGALGDYFTRTRKSGRYLLTWLFAPIMIPALAFVCFQQNVGIMMVALGTFILSASLLATLSFAIIQDIVPAQFRGRTLASFGVVQQIVGLGVGPLLVAGVTDYVLRDPNRINASLFLVQTPLWLLALALAVPAFRRFPAMRQSA